MACLFLMTSGCSRFIGTLVDSAAETAGQTVGERMAEGMLADLGPGTLHSYTMALFQMTFYYGGYNLAVDNYEPGDYTRWKAKGVTQGEWFERALIKRKENGAEWWRVESHDETEGGKDKIFIAEALLSAPNEETGQRKILRMRVKYPDEEEPSEVPVTEKDSKQWVINTKRTLTEESYKGMKVGTEQLSTPAGTFQTEHLQTDYYGGDGQINWWLSEKVPGEVVKYNQIIEDTEEGQKRTQYEVTLTAFGQDATSSKLGVFEDRKSSDSK